MGSSSFAMLALQLLPDLAQAKIAIG
jgi:hypothetical protein